MRQQASRLPRVPPVPQLPNTAMWPPAGAPGELVSSGVLLCFSCAGRRCRSRIRFAMLKERLVDIVGESTPDAFEGGLRAFTNQINADLKEIRKAAARLTKMAGRSRQPLGQKVSEVSAGARDCATRTSTMLREALRFFPEGTPDHAAVLGLAEQFRVALQEYEKACRALAAPAWAAGLGEAGEVVADSHGQVQRLQEQQQVLHEQQAVSTTSPWPPIWWSPSSAARVGWMAPAVPPGRQSVTSGRPRPHAHCFTGRAPPHPPRMSCVPRHTHIASAAPR
jgi:hypothetical protein